MPFVAWAAFCLAPLCMAPLCMAWRSFAWHPFAWAAFCVMAFALCPICARPFIAWSDLPMRRICRVTRLGGVAAAVVLESWLMERAFARRPRGMPFIDFDAGHA